MKNKKLLIGGLVIFVLVVVPSVVWFVSRPKPNYDDSIEVPVISPEQQTAVESIDAVDDINDVAYSVSKKALYVSSLDENKIYVIDIKTHAVLNKIDVALPNKLLLLDAQDRLFVSARDSKLIALDTNTFDVKGEVEVGIRSSEIAVDPLNKYLFVVSELTDSLTVVDLTSFTAVKTLLVGSSPRDVVVGRSGEYAYVSCEDAGWVSVISVATLEKVTTLNNVGRPGALLAYPDKDLILIADRYNHQVLVYDEKNNEVARRIDVVKFPADLSYDDRARVIYVAGFMENQVGVLDLATESLSRKLQISSAFEQVPGLNNAVYIPNENEIVVTNTNEGKVYFVKIN